MNYIEATIASEPADGTKEIEKALVIPEKASSFRIHPDKICQDQCFYCGGRFGLFDTPCHVAQIKSLERQKKILDSALNVKRQIGEFIQKFSLFLFPIFQMKKN